MSSSPITYTLCTNFKDLFSVPSDTILIAEALLREPGTAIDVTKTEMEGGVHLRIELSRGELSRTIIIDKIELDDKHEVAKMLNRRDNKEKRLFGDTWTQVIYAAYDQLLSYSGRKHAAKIIHKYICIVEEERDYVESAMDVDMEMSGMEVDEDKEYSCGTATARIDKAAGLEKFSKGPSVKATMTPHVFNVRHSLRRPTTLMYEDLVQCSM